MATVPGATTTVSQTAGAPGAGLDLICVISPCATNADNIPRLFGSAADVYALHGYSEGCEYVAHHVPKTGLSVLFVAIAIATPGVIGRVDKTGNTGSAIATVTAGGDGVLHEHDGKVTVITGGTIGSSQIILGLSLDGGRTTKRVRLGTASSYAIPYINATLSFGAGTLTAGDTVITWHGTGPRGDATGWANARAKLAEQTKLFRSALLTGELQNSTEAQAFLDEIEAYEIENGRFIYARADVPDRLPLAALSHEVVRTTGAPSITFAEVGGTGDTITRSAGSFIADGFAVGDTIVVSGAVATSGYNNITGVIASLSDTVITLGSTDLIAEGPISNVSIVGYPTLTFAEVGSTADTITRNRGSFVADGFRAGDLVTVAGTASNNVTTDALASVTALVLTLGSTDLAAEVIGITSSVTITAGQTKAAHVAAKDAAFASVTSVDGRLDLSIGRGRVTSPLSGWAYRRPASWFASMREYQHDLHHPTWRKSDGPCGADLYDTDGTTLLEYDDRVDGGAASAARFTSLRSWGNGPGGAFVSQALTRAEDESLMSRTHNAAVVNYACTLVQSLSENVAIGRDLVLQANGKATKASLASVERSVNESLASKLLTDQRGEGQRASLVKFSANPDDLYNVAEPVMNTTTDLVLNGTVHTIHNKVRLLSAGS